MSLLFCTSSTVASRLRPSLRRAVVAAGIATTLLISAPVADAHVRVRPDSTASGSFSALTFRVPNESANAGTVAVSVELPQDAPFLFVSTRPVPGWTARRIEEPLPKPITTEGTTVTKAVRRVVWTADKGARIRPGEYQEFSVSVGPLPAPGTLLLPATQTYSDGEIVRWDEPASASGEEPEHPAPAFEVTAAAGDHSSSTPSPSAQGGGASADPAARVLGGAGLVAGLAGIGVGAVALRSRRSPSA